jgi:hypothetical protein
MTHKITESTHSVEKQVRRGVILTGKMKVTRSVSLFLLLGGGSAFMLPTQSSSSSSSALHMGLFDGFKGMGSGKDDLDEQWERQQEILKNRRKPQAEREQYFNKVAQRRAEATAKQEQMWAWQKKSYAKGEDPLDEWKKRRADGSISDLDNQYGDPKKIGGIPLPMASFGVGGEFGVSFRRVC